MYCMDPSYTILKFQMRAVGCAQGYEHICEFLNPEWQLKFGQCILGMIVHINDTAETTDDSTDDSVKVFEIVFWLGLQILLLP